MEVSGQHTIEVGSSSLDTKRRPKHGGKSCLTGDIKGIKSCGHLKGVMPESSSSRPC
jgi:hypothetical protein